MNKYPSPIVIMVFGVCCITAGMMSVYFADKFSPPELGLVGSQSVGPAHLMSTIDLQRELNRLYPRLKLKEDGVYGPATKAAHERAIGDQYAKELMVREVDK